MNRAIWTATGILIVSHTLFALLSKHTSDNPITSFYPTPFDSTWYTETLPDSTHITYSDPNIDSVPEISAPQDSLYQGPAKDELADSAGLPAPADSVTEHTETSIINTDSVTTDNPIQNDLLAHSKPVDKNISESQALSPVAIVPVVPQPEPEPTLSPEDSLLLLIPEKAWPDSHRTRYELTPDIARTYPTGKFIPREIPNTAWGVGEKLVFSIDYGFYSAGTATMSVLDIEDVNGDECFHIQTTAHSNSFISAFYEVNDQVNSYIDTKGIFSRRIEKLLREGSYKSDRFVDFYPDRMIALNTEEKHAVTDIPLYVQDVLSSLYFIRTYDLEVGKDIYVDTYADGKVYPLRVSVHKIETIKVPAGKFKCYVVEPFLQSDGIFRQKGQLKVWLTTDEHRIPVKMTSKIVIGSIGTNLESFTLGVTE